MELISVIVPIYNVEKYLRRCVDSIIAQTYSNLEIILVDDGSTDNCGKICDEYATKDSRIIVIHQKNSGLSAARNAGLEKAIGNYISFIDSDDYIDNNYFSTMIKLIMQCDMVSCIIIDENEDGFPYNIKTTEDRHYSPSEALSEMCYEKKIGTSACGKLIKKRLTDNCHFPEGKLYEDLFTVYKWYVSSKTIASTSKTAYHYVHHFGSISNNDWNDKTTDLMEAAENLLTFASSSYQECYKDTVFRYFFSANEFLIKAYRTDKYKSIFMPYKKRLRSLWKDLDKKSLSLKDYIKFKAMIVSPTLHRIINNVYHRVKR